MEIERVAKYEQPWSLLRLVVVYATCVGLDVLWLAITVSALSAADAGAGFTIGALFAVILPMHLLCGYIVTRFVSSRIIWWSQADNVMNVYRTKMSMLVTWLTAVPTLVWRIVVTKGL